MCIQSRLSSCCFCTFSYNISSSWRVTFWVFPMLVEPPEPDWETSSRLRRPLQLLGSADVWFDLVWADSVLGGALKRSSCWAAASLLLLSICVTLEPPPLSCPVLSLCAADSLFNHRSSWLKGLVGGGGVLLKMWCPRGLDMWGQTESAAGGNAVTSSIPDICLTGSWLQSAF